MPRGDGRGEGVDLALISYPVDAGGGHLFDEERDDVRVHRAQGQLWRRTRVEEHTERSRHEESAWPPPAQYE